MPPLRDSAGGPCLTGCLSDHIQLTRCIVHSGALPVCLAGAARLSPGAHVWAGYGGGGGGFAPSSDDERVWFPVLALFKEEEQKEDEEEEEQEGGKRWLIKIKTSTKKGKKIKIFFSQTTLRSLLFSLDSLVAFGRMPQPHRVLRISNDNGPLPARGKQSVCSPPGARWLSPAAWRRPTDPGQRGGEGGRGWATAITGGGDPTS